MKVKFNLLYKAALFLLLLLPIAVASAELNILLSLFFLVFVLLDFKVKYTYTFLSSLLPLIIIVVIGSIISILYKSEFYDYIKDLFVFLKPLLFIVLGYYLVCKIKDKDFLFKLIIYLAILFAIVHLYEVFVYLTKKPFIISSIRYYGGKANYIELFAATIIIVNWKQQLFKFSIKYFSIIKIILLISFFFYFSRTMMVGVFLMVFAAKGYFVLTKKSIKYLLLFIVGGLLFYVFLYSINLERGSEGVEGFLYKIKIAPTEIFATDIDKNSSHDQLWDKWRGYEAYKALEQLNDTDLKFGLLLGKGFGSLVDLEFVAPLNDEGVQFIPKIHNGYVNIIFKTGLVGMCFYFLFLFYIYMQSYTKWDNEKGKTVNYIMSSIAIFYLFSSFIISGIYNQADVFALVLGGLLYLKNYYRYINKIEV